MQITLDKILVISIVTNVILFYRLFKNKRVIEKSYKEVNEREKLIISLQEQKNSLERSLFLEEERSQSLKDSFSKEFENLAHKIMDQKTIQYEKQTKVSIQEILAPMKENLKIFNNRIETIYSDENKERYSLKTEIQNFIKTNEKMENETQNLVKALKGDVKTQGAWGEMILTKILESSGLQENEEYILQGKGLGLESNGKVQKPDVIINLPEGGHIVIDSKVSLTDYERYISEEDSGKKQIHLKSLLNH